ncbi:MAG: hypothetical protein LC620_07250, partial [Halobacteriales archaeon]|nr:hypothetical protein [Halobacteriales archaeon]
MQATKDWKGAVAAGAVLAAVLLGLRLRLADPLADPVLAAEDPYNHMALVREHLRDGTIQPLNTGGDVYPPGLHAVIAAFWSATGMDLYTIFRFAAPVLGAVGVLGVGLLLWRTAGRTAAAIGAFAMAVLPEAVFRTAMLAPTALDLALLPFLLLALVETVAGRLAWAVPAACLAALLLLAHPWVFAILVPAGAAYVLLALLAPWPRAKGPPISALGLAATTAILGCACALALGGCWGACGPGFARILPGGAALKALAPAALGAAILVPVALAVFARRLQPLLDGAARPAGLRRRIVALAAAPVALLGLGALALRAGLPDQVDLVHMMGWPVLALGVAAILTLPFLASPGSHAGAAVVAATAPFTLLDPFRSPYWPHRTAVYLGLGLAMLAGVLGSGMVPLVARIAARQPSTRPRPRPMVLLAAVAPLALLSLVGGAVAVTPGYGHGWYRLY